MLKAVAKRNGISDLHSRGAEADEPSLSDEEVESMDFVLVNLPKRVCIGLGHGSGIRVAPEVQYFIAAKRLSVKVSIGLHDPFGVLVSSTSRDAPGFRAFQVCSMCLGEETISVMFEDFREYIE